MKEHHNDLSAKFITFKTLSPSYLSPSPKTNADSGSKIKEKIWIFIHFIGLFFDKLVTPLVPTYGRVDFIKKIISPNAVMN